MTSVQAVLAPFGSSPSALDFVSSQATHLLLSTRWFASQVYFSHDVSAPLAGSPESGEAGSAVRASCP